jgi:outer membrane protein OmpA-like peptidoglycan-associated protein
MKKTFAIGIITSIILVGCGEVTNQNIAPKRVADMMSEKQIVGWENYKDDDDKDKVPNYLDECPNTPLNAPVDKQGCAIDSDNDGVADYKDECPNTPEGIVVGENGCAIDSDNDGVYDYKDKCPNTPAGIEVDMYGCGIDRDRDGVIDINDRCANTPIGAIVDENGCSLDDDKDGVANGIDKCPNTPSGAQVDKNGCAIDSDKDKVIDLFDKCPNTPKDVVVGVDGCPLDTDRDGVPDVKDKCPDTPKDVKVNFQGCPVLAEYRFNFEFNSAKIDKKYYPQIKKLADVLKNNKSIKIEIQGYTDNTGSYVYNKELSLKRANALREILIKKFKISPERISIIGYGSDYPVASNATKEGQAQNRRILVIDKTNNIQALLSNSTEVKTDEVEKSENISPAKIDK